MWRQGTVQCLVSTSQHCSRALQDSQSCPISVVDFKILELFEQHLIGEVPDNQAFFSDDIRQGLFSSAPIDKNDSSGLKRFTDEGHCEFLLCIDSGTIQLLVWLWLGTRSTSIGKANLASAVMATAISPPKHMSSRVLFLSPPSKKDLILGHICDRLYPIGLFHYWHKAKCWKVCNCLLVTCSCDLHHREQFWWFFFVETSINLFARPKFAGSVLWTLLIQRSSSSWWDLWLAGALFNTWRFHIHTKSVGVQGTHCLFLSLGAQDTPSLGLSWSRVCGDKASLCNLVSMCISSKAISLSLAQSNGVRNHCLLVMLILLQHTRPSHKSFYCPNFYGALLVIFRKYALRHMHMHLWIVTLVLLLITHLYFFCFISFFGLGCQVPSWGGCPAGTSNFSQLSVPNMHKQYTINLCFFVPLPNNPTVCTS